MNALSSEILSESDQMLGEVICDYLKAVETGQAPNRQALLERHALITDDLAAFFADRDRLERLAGPLREATQVAAVATLPGSHVGAYEILEEIGRGGMGAVYAARQDRPRRVVALKMILAGTWAGREQLERFEAESEILARLQHPNIVGVHEVGEHEGRPYFTMDYAEGGNLARKLAVAPLPSREAAELLKTLAQAVHGAHAQGIVHRDLKPSNVLLAGDQTPLIGDFGLAKQLAGEPGQESAADWTQTGAILGTPSYMAPEQAAGSSKDIGTAADVYSLGAILYECVTGRPPFKAPTVAQTLEQIRTQEPVPPGRLLTTLPRDLETICLKCLEKDPQRRYSSARALAEDLERWLTGEPIKARRVGRSEHLWRWCRRHPAAAALVAVVLAASVALPVGLLVYNARLQRAVDRADSNLAEAHLQHELSDARYRVARDSMHRMVDRLNAQRLADVPKLQELRQELLEDALAFYQSALQQADESDPVVRRDAAFAFAETGAIQSLMGKAGSSDELFRQAITLIEGLPAEYRDRPGCRHRLAVCHSHLGAHAGAASQFVEAERHHRAEQALYVQLTRDEPGNADWQNELARSEHHLGRVFLSTKRLPEAHTHYHRAVEIRTRLVGEHPKNENFQAQLAETCNNLAVVLGSLNRGPEARSASEKAIGLLRTLVERHPENLDWKMSLAGTYSNVGLGLMKEGKPREALKLLDRAVERIDDALQQEPRHDVAQERAFNIHGARAQVHESLKDWPAAVKDWDRVIAVDRWPDPWLRLLFRALDLARMGDHARAAAEAKTLLKEQTLPDEAVFVLVVRLYALSIEPAQKDVRLTADEQSRLAEGYAMQALSLLRRLQAKGYFQDSENAKELASDSELRSLRGREDFQRLLKQVKGRKK